MSLFNLYGNKRAKNTFWAKGGPANHLYNASPNHAAAGQQIERLWMALGLQKLQTISIVNMAIALQDVAKQPNKMQIP